MIAEPCCMHKLVHALHQAPRRVLSFHTYGDVDLEHFYRGVACLMTEPHVMVVTVTRLNIATANYILHCFERGWITDLVLTTATDCTKLIQSTFASHIAHVSYVCSPYITEASGQMVLYTSPGANPDVPHQALILTGHIPAIADKGLLTAYTLIFQPDIPVNIYGEHGDYLTNALLPVSLLHRQRNIAHKGTSRALADFREHIYVDK